MGFGTPTAGFLAGAALFLDFDGTLVELTPTPDGTRVDGPLLTLLAEVRASLGGRLAIVSGRSIEVLRGTFGLGDFWLAGSHGLELAAPHLDIESPARDPAIDEAQRALEVFVADKPGLFVEPKALGVGLHFRPAPQFQRACEAFTERLARETGLVNQHGKMMYELRPGGADKGTAIGALLQRTPFLGGRPIFFGDDLTDEAGFSEVVKHHGAGVLVGPERQSAARYRLEDVEAVRALLRAAP